MSFPVPNPVPVVSPDFDSTATDLGTPTSPMPVVAPADYEPAPGPVPVPVYPVGPVAPVYPAPVVPVPDQPAPEGTAHADLVSAAATKSWRTLFQTAVATSLVSGLGVAGTYLQNGDLSHLDWKALGMGVAVAAGTPLVTFLHNMLGTAE